MRKLGFGLGLIVGASALFFYQAIEEKSTPSAFPVIERLGYNVAYDSRAKIPLWTSETLTQESLKKEVKRKKMRFREDPDLYPPHRSTLKDYANSGYDRGHTVPAGDSSFCEEALQETFYLSNIAPQDPTCNRGIWSQLERKVRRLVEEEGEVKVVTGPLFMPHQENNGKRYVKYEVIGESDVAVPTHFFKVVQGRRQTEAYVIPNEAVIGKVEDYRFPLEKLERISGVYFKKIIYPVGN